MDGIWERERERGDGRGEETNLSDSARTVRDRQCCFRGYGIDDTVMREFRSVGTVGRQCSDNNSGDSIVQRCKGTRSGHGQECKGVLHVGVTDMI
jgi:hypothetical protein